MEVGKGKGIAIWACFACGRGERVTSYDLLRFVERENVRHVVVFFALLVLLCFASLYIAFLCFAFRSFEATF